MTALAQRHQFGIELGEAQRRIQRWKDKNEPMYDVAVIALEERFKEALRHIMKGIIPGGYFSHIQIIRESSGLHPSWPNAPQSILGFYRNPKTREPFEAWPDRFWDLTSDYLGGSCGNGFSLGLQYQITGFIPPNIFGLYRVPAPDENPYRKAGWDPVRYDHNESDLTGRPFPGRPVPRLQNGY